MKTFLYQESEFTTENQMASKSELPMMNVINMALKNKIMTLKNLIEMKEMTLNDPKFDIKKSLDTLMGNMESFFFVWMSWISVVTMMVSSEAATRGVR